MENNFTSSSVVLVTGGAGFIGSHTVDLLLQAGLAVRVLDNLSTGRLGNISKSANVEFLHGDICDFEAVDRAMAGVTHVLHLAAQVSVAFSIENPLVSASNNITGFLNVLESAKRHGVRRFVYASSAAVYGVPVFLPLDEESPLKPLSPYGLEKLINDNYAALYGDLHGLSILGLRYFNVYGPRQDPRSSYSGVITIFNDRLHSRQPITIFGDGTQTRDFIYVADVAKSNLAALSSDFSGICNVATGHSVTLLQLVEQMSDVAGYRPEICFSPDRNGDIRNSAACNSRLKSHLGVNEFVPLRDGLAALWEADSQLDCVKNNG